MSSRVRLLPTLIGTTGVLLCLRIGAMAASPDAPDAGSNPADPPAASDTAQPGAAAPPATSSDAEGNKAAEGGGADPQQLAQAGGFDASTGVVTEAVAQSKGEAEVLQKLGERRAELDARSQDLGLREQLLLAAERQLDSRLADLKQLEQKLDAMMTKRNEQEEAQAAALVKTYESMKPEDAARIFNRLERTILVDVASRMKPAKIGAIMAAMEPARAQDLTVLLAKRFKLSEMQPIPAATPPKGIPASTDPGYSNEGGLGVPLSPQSGPNTSPSGEGAPNG